MRKLTVLCGLGLALALVSGCGQEELNTANSLIDSQAAADEESFDLGKRNGRSKGEWRQKAGKKSKWESRSKYDKYDDCDDDDEEDDDEDSSSGVMPPAEPDVGQPAAPMPAPAPMPTPVDPSVALEQLYMSSVKAIIDQRCATCHASTNPKLTNFAQVKSASSKAASAVNGGSMPLGSALSASDKATLVDFFTKVSKLP